MGKDLLLFRCRDIYNPWSITKFMDSGGIFDLYTLSLVNVEVKKM